VLVGGRELVKENSKMNFAKEGQSRTGLLDRMQGTMSAAGGWHDHGDLRGRVEKSSTEGSPRTLQTGKQCTLHTTQKISKVKERKSQGSSAVVSDL